MKKCKICKSQKKLTEFNVCSKMKDGHSSYCRACAHDKVKRWRTENAEHRKVYSKAYRGANSEKALQWSRDYRANNIDRVKIVRKKYAADNPERMLVYDAKKRAKARNVAFSITHKDIIIPEFCPILGVRLERKGYAYRDTSPSIDCINPKLGYIKGNIGVISYRANRIKNDSTVEEIRAVADWYEKKLMEAGYEV